MGEAWGGVWHTVVSAVGFACTRVFTICGSLAAKFAIGTLDPSPGDLCGGAVVLASAGLCRCIVWSGDGVDLFGGFGCTNARKQIRHRDDDVSR